VAQLTDFPGPVLRRCRKLHRDERRTQGWRSTADLDCVQLYAAYLSALRIDGSACEDGLQCPINCSSLIEAPPPPLPR